MSVPVLANLAVLQIPPAMAQTLFMYAAIFAIFYFLFMRPQQKTKKMHQDLVNNLKKGDEVVTAGGIIGEVVHIAQQSKEGTPIATMDDRITIKSGESRLVVERGRITRVVTTQSA